MRLLIQGSLPGRERQHFVIAAVTWDIDKETEAQSCQATLLRYHSRQLSRASDLSLLTPHSRLFFLPLFLAELGSKTKQAGQPSTQLLQRPTNKAFHPGCAYRAAVCPASSPLRQRRQGSAEPVLLALLPMEAKAGLYQGIQGATLHWALRKCGVFCTHCCPLVSL